MTALTAVTNLHYLAAAAFLAATSGAPSTPTAMTFAPSASGRPTPASTYSAPPARKSTGLPIGPGDRDRNPRLAGVNTCPGARSVP